MADLLAHAGSVDQLFQDIAERLKNVVSFQVLNLSLYDPATRVMRLNIWVGPPGPRVGSELPASETVGGWVWEHQLPLVCPDVISESRFPQVMAILREQGV